MSSRELRDNPEALLAEAQQAEIAWTQAKTPQEKMQALKKVAGSYDLLAQMDPGQKGQAEMYKGLLFNAEKQLRDNDGVEQFFSKDEESVLEEVPTGERSEAKFEEEKGVQALKDEVEGLDIDFIDMQERQAEAQAKVDNWTGRIDDPEFLAAKRKVRVLQKRMDKIDEKIEELEDQIDRIEGRASANNDNSEKIKDEEMPSGSLEEANELIKKFNQDFGQQGTKSTSVDKITQMEDDFMIFFKGMDEIQNPSDADRKVFQDVLRKVDYLYKNVERLDGESIGGKELHLQKGMVEQYIKNAKKRLGL